MEDFLADALSKLDLSNVFLDEWMAIDRNIVFLDGLKPGHAIKVGNRIERFYARVVQVDGDVIIARVIDYLRYTKEYNEGDFIKVKRENVLSYL
jgi:hypothetical protein